MTITDQDTRHIAKLARLRFTDNEIEKMAKELNTILDYVHKLDELDTNKVEPLNHVIDLQNVFREDEVKPSTDVNEILKNAPSKTEQFFRVPKVIG
jgi:aspartyl-tRNA(Asn)/glutamyl-tRNA(Gln) amidotransferase subunit C